VYGLKFVDFQIYNNLLPWHILISRTVFEIQGPKKTKKIPPPLILGKYYLDCVVQGRHSFCLEYLEWKTCLVSQFSRQLYTVLMWDWCCHHRPSAHNRKILHLVLINVFQVQALESQSLQFTPHDRNAFEKIEPAILTRWLMRFVEFTDIFIPTKKRQCKVSRRLRHDNFAKSKRWYQRHFGVFNKG